MVVDVDRETADILIKGLLFAGSETTEGKVCAAFVKAYQEGRIRIVDVSNHGDREPLDSTPLAGQLLGPEYDPYSATNYGVPDHERGLPRDAGESSMVGSWRDGGDGVGSWDPETGVYIAGGDGYGFFGPTQTGWQDGGNGCGSSINFLNPTILPSGGGGG